MGVSVSLSFRLSVVTSADVATAYAFHEHIAGTDEHIWPRTREELQAIAEQNALFGVRRTDTGEFVGLCYVKRDSDTEPFELGGLTVAQEYRSTGIGKILVRFALAHAMVYDDPWSTDQDVIAHVHESNNNPRPLLEALFFEHVERKKYPGKGFPSSMKRDAEGNVGGDTFRFTRKGLRALADWFTTDFRGTLKSGAQVSIELGPVTIGEMLAALREMTNQYPPDEIRALPSQT
jgi:GNAT superfamily N-acetyltransferase